MIKKIMIICLTLCSISFAQDMSPEKKIGQMIMVGFRGTEFNESNSMLKEQIRNGDIGGVLALPYNIENKKQIIPVIKELNDIQAERPIFIAIDQEGGKVARFDKKKGFKDFPSAEQTSRKLSLKKAQKMYGKMANILKESGINLNFAPVVDLNINPESPAIGKLGRSFSADPKVVINYADVFIKAHADHGVLTCIKHYPGHGSAKDDSHNGVTDVTNTWSALELIPYESLTADEHKINMIMTAHVFNAYLDKKYPASLSKEIVQTMLRDNIGYDGVIISDDLQMKAISEMFSFEDVVVNAVNSGTDILLFAGYFDPDPYVAVKAKDVIIKAINDGRIKMERINESFNRIINLKKSLNKVSMQ
ncbi:MAG: glycoside hydrolase family 3 N-terminal domain-containing protein [Elusimicrobiota bacterium]